MTDNIHEPPGAAHRVGYLPAVPCPSGSLVTYLTLLDGRVVHECHETLFPERPQSWFDGYEGYNDSSAHLERRYERSSYRPPPQPTREELAQQKLSVLAGYVGGAAALDALNADPLEASDDLLISARLPSMDDGAQIDELVDIVAQRWFQPEAQQALRRAASLVATEHPAFLDQWSADKFMGATCWAIGKANGLFGRGKLVQRDLLASIGLAAYVSDEGRRVAQWLNDSAGVAYPPILNPWGYEWDPDARQLQDLTPVGRPELLLAETRALIIRLRDGAPCEVASGQEATDGEDSAAAPVQTLAQFDGKAANARCGCSGVQGWDARGRVSP